MALPCPNNDQRQLVSEYIWNDDLNGGRGAFLSPELRGDNPEVYREEWLDDLVVFEHGAESMDAFARWVTQPLLEAAHFCCLGRNKVRLSLSCVLGCRMRDFLPSSGLVDLSECSYYKNTCQTKY